MRSEGEDSVLAPTDPPRLAEPSVNNAWPSKKLAGADDTGGKRSTRLLPWSHTHRLPALSMATPEGPFRDEAVARPEPAVLRFGAPHTSVPTVEVPW